MGILDKIKEPVFLKETSAAALQLEQLLHLAEGASDSMRPKIEQEIKMVRAGIYGEENIAFELKNSHIPMIVLHDLFLECGDLSAQIDYLILTRKHIFVVECKNLIGNIEINSNGDFIRTFQSGKRIQKEGIYSPITQNKRHLELVYALRRETKGNLITKFLFDKNFTDTYRSIVVLANPKTYLNARFAKKEVKQQVIRADQLNEYIRRVDAEPEAVSMSEQTMMELAQFFLERHKEQSVDYTEKYQVAATETGIKEALEPIESKSEQLLCPQCGAPMVRRKAKRGENAGREFYGCSRFPQCRGIINIL